MKHTFVFTAVTLATLFTLSQAEIPRFEKLGSTLKGENESDRMGYSVVPVGKWHTTDDHFAVGAPGHDNDRGKVRVIRRDTGPDIWITSHFIGQNEGDEFGSFVYRIPDISGNGKEEMIVSATKYGIGESGKVYIYEGGTIGSSTTYTTPFKVINAPIIRSRIPKFFGKSVAHGDIQGLGDEPDLVISASGSDQVFLYKWSTFLGQDQYVKYRTHTGQDGSSFGASVAVVGDVNGDGYEDYLIGAPDWVDADVDTLGAAYLYSGDDGSLLWNDSGINAPPGVNLPQALYGNAVIAAGDWNDDGVPDFAVGAPGSFDITIPPNGRCCQGIVTVYKGASGATLGDVLFSRKAETNRHPVNFGFSLAGGIDFGADGQLDLLVGVPQDGTNIPLEETLGRTNVVDGSTGNISFDELGTEPDTSGGLPGLLGIGFAVAIAGDLDGDGLLDIISGGPLVDDDGENRGHMNAYRSFFLGDVNATNTVNDSDVVALENYVFDATALDQLVAADFDEDGDVDQDDICALNDHVGSSWFMLGDVNKSGSITVADVTYLISFLTGDPAGPRPDPWLSGDVNLDCVIDSVDITCLIDYIFNSGPLPCE